MTDSPECQPAQGGEVADLGGGEFRGSAEVESFEGRLVLEPGGADPAGQGHGLAAGDLVLAQDLQEVQVAEFPGGGLGEPGVEGGEHAGQFQLPQRGGQRGAVGDGDAGHGAVLRDGGEDADVVAGDLPVGADPAAGRAGAGVAGRLAAGGGGQQRDRSRPAGRAGQVSGHLDGDLVLIDGQGQAGDAGLLDERGGGAQRVRQGGQRPGREQPRRRRPDGGHDVAPVPAPATASLVIVPGIGMTLANDAGPRRNAAAPPSPAAAGSWPRFGAGGQDALDGPVGRVPGGDRLRAGGLEPGRVVPVGQADHALGGAQPVERVVGEQLADDLLAGRADALGLLAAPGRGAHVERDLLRRVVAEVGLLAPVLARVGLDQLPADEELHHRVGDAHVGGLADVPPRHRVQHLLRPGRGCRGRSSPSPTWPARTARPAAAAARPSRPRRTPRPGRRPSSGRHARPPATSADQRSASACICARLVNSRPRQNESRTYGIGRSTLRLAPHRQLHLIRVIGTDGSG